MRLNIKREDFIGNRFLGCDPGGAAGMAPELLVRRVGKRMVGRADRFGSLAVHGLRRPVETYPADPSRCRSSVRTKRTLPGSARTMVAGPPAFPPVVVGGMRQEDTERCPSAVRGAPGAATLGDGHELAGGRAIASGALPGLPWAGAEGPVHSRALAGDRGRHGRKVPVGHRPVPAGPRLDPRRRLLGGGVPREMTADFVSIAK